MRRQSNKIACCCAAEGRPWLLIGLVICACAFNWSSLARENNEGPPRALPAKWPQDVLNTFFADAREQLQGERPDFGSPARIADVAKNPIGDEHAAREERGGGSHWSSLIRPETLEDEVKRISNRVAQQVATATEFKGGNFRTCRREYSLLGVLFAVIGEYDQHVRWRDEADAYRDLFARAGFDCQVGSDQSYRVALARSHDLRSLIRGSRVGQPESAARTVWPAVADRVPLMQRMEQAHESRLAKWLAVPSEFHGNLREIRHEAELLAVLAEVISREGYQFSGEENYSRFAGQLRDAARGVVEAAASQDYQQASQAALTITDACINCHEWYR